MASGCVFCRDWVDKRVGDERMGDLTYLYMMPDFALSDLHLSISSSAATFEAEALTTPGRNVVRSISSHWR